MPKTVATGKEGTGQLLRDASSHPHQMLLDLGDLLPIQHPSKFPSRVYPTSSSEPPSSNSPTTMMCLENFRRITDASEPVDNSKRERADIRADESEPGSIGTTDIPKGDIAKLDAPMRVEVMAQTQTIERVGVDHCEAARNGFIAYGPGKPEVCVGVEDAHLK